jgi:hypothetical protein
VPASTLAVKFVAASVGDAVLPSTVPETSWAATRSLDVPLAVREASSTEPVSGSGVVDWVGSFSVVSPDEPESSVGADAGSVGEGVASVGSEEVGSAAGAVASGVVVSGWTTGSGSATGSAISVVEVGSDGVPVAVPAASEVSAVAVEASWVTLLVVSAVVSTVAVAAAGSTSTVWSLMCPPCPQT